MEIGFPKKREEIFDFFRNPISSLFLAPGGRLSPAHFTVFMVVLGITACNLGGTDIVEIIHTIVGIQNPEVVMLEYDSDTDFDATFLIWNTSLDSGMQVILQKSPAPATANTAAQPHFVSKLFTIEISPSQDFIGTFLLMVKNESTSGSGEDLGIVITGSLSGVL